MCEFTHIYQQVHLHSGPFLETVVIGSFINLYLPLETRIVSLSQAAITLNKDRRKSHIINLVVQALNADWLTVVVYHPVYYAYDKAFIFTALIMLVTSLQ